MTRMEGLSNKPDTRPNLCLIVRVLSKESNKSSKNRSIMLPIMLREQYLLDIKVVVEMEKVPPELVFNWDHTGINIVATNLPRKDTSLFTKICLSKRLEHNIYSHWSNVEKMKQYIHKIIIPYVTAKQIYLKLQPNYTALAIYDEFKGQLIFSLFEANNIIVVKVPAN